MSSKKKPMVTRKKPAPPAAAAGDFDSLVGYSFNNADEHFNDILRQQLSDKQIAVVGPGVFSDEFIERMSKVFHVPSDNWVSTRTQELEAKKAGNITLIKAFADQFNVATFFGNS